MAANISETVAASNRDEALKGLYDQLTRENLFPFWATSTAVDHDAQIVANFVAKHDAAVDEGGRHQSVSVTFVK